MSDDAPFLIYVTVPSADEAARIGRALIEARLAACANVIGPVRSIFRWQGAVRDDSEYILIAKTRRANVDALTARTVELHSYTLPCVVAMPIEGGNAPFLEWIAAETGGDEKGR